MKKFSIILCLVLGFCIALFFTIKCSTDKQREEISISYKDKTLSNGSIVFFDLGEHVLDVKSSGYSAKITFNEYYSFDVIVDDEVYSSNNLGELTQFFNVKFDTDKIVFTFEEGFSVDNILSSLFPSSTISTNFDFSKKPLFQLELSSLKTDFTTCINFGCFYDGFVFLYPKDIIL